MTATRTAGLLVLAPLSAIAHESGPLQPDDLWRAWEFDPGVVLPLAISAVLYLRGGRAARGVLARQMWCFWGGWCFLAIALVSPLHPLGEVLFSAHMAQHEILMLVAAPLLALSRPLTPFLWGMPFKWRRAIGRWSKTAAVQRGWRVIVEPGAAWCISAGALWAWHSPKLFQATLTSDLVHTAQHLSFFVSALLFWWSLLYSHGSLGYGGAVFYIFTTAIHTSILGALLTFAPLVWYPAYQATAPIWGVTALKDQQLGGLIMWVPAGVVYLAAGLACFSAWLQQSDAMLGRGQHVR